MNVSLTWVDDAGHGFQDRGLTRTIRAEHGNDLSLGYLQADTAQGAHGPIGALDVGEREHVGHVDPCAAGRRKLVTSSAVPR